MSALLDAPVMTTEELLAMPRNGMERWLIDGQAAGETDDGPKPSSQPNHGAILAFLESWRERQPEPAAWFSAAKQAADCVAIPIRPSAQDVVYVAANLAMQEPDDTTLIDGVPTLIIEILSPSDVIEEIKDKINLIKRSACRWSG